jgi:uncharacterized protein with NAD-binding domain and iron-sulfur cluster
MSGLPPAAQPPGGQPQAREKVAIVGGGIGALTTAYFLSDPALGGRYEVSVYTMGWRLGGKGASGRNAELHDRIEEHGLHIWFGTYHNAIAMMRRCYAELGRPPGMPLASFGDAFKGQSRVALTETVAGHERDWAIDFPDAPALGHDLTVLTLLRRVIAWILDRARAVSGLDQVALGGLAARIGRVEAVISHLTAGAAPAAHHAGHLLDWLAGLMPALDGRIERRLLSGGLKLLAHALWDLLSPRLPEDDFSRRTWILVYLAITVGRGIIDDQLVENGFGAVDGEELRAWFQRHSSFEGDEGHVADPLAFQSPCLQAYYDCSFSYAEGNVAKPNIAAGIGLRGMLRIMLDYSGPIILEMQAGMGDAVFTPLYRVLAKRGVAFHFFHRLTGVTLDADGKGVASLEFSRQVALSGPSYQPLVTVNDLECWPSTPNFAQIVDGDKLKASGANLEHWNSGWTDAGPPLTLHSGADFARVVLAVSYAVLPAITAPLAAASPRWKAMLEGLGVTDTVAAQLWFARTREDLGRSGPADIIGGFVEPWSSLSDFTHLLPRENWPAVGAPACLYYSCGPIGNAAPPDDEGVFANLKAFLEKSGATLWPAAGAPGNFDWSALWAPAGAVGEDRLRAQYWRVNSDPTEQYVISAAGTAGVRLRADQSGFDNLLIAGEWTDTAVNISAIESTVISGMRAARAICGMPQTIIGEDL